MYRTLPTPPRASMLFMDSSGSSWDHFMTRQGLEPKPLDLLQLNHATRPTDDLQARTVFFYFGFFLFLYSDIINLMTELLSFIPTHQETTERTRWVRIELGRNFLRKHFLTGFRIYGTIYQMSWGLLISVFLLLRNYALPSIKIRSLTPCALIPPGQKSAVS